VAQISSCAENSAPNGTKIIFLENTINFTIINFWLKLEQNSGFKYFAVF
jgi:hypothetical protein